MLGLLLAKIIKRGTLTVEWPDGQTTTYGAGAPRAAIRLLGSWTPWAIGLRPDLAFGEAYMDGKLTVERGTIADVLEIIVSNLVRGPVPGIMRASQTMRRWLRPIRQFNSGRRARRNVGHHYDLSKSLYELFLDRDLNYSCAYFQTPDMTLEEAQRAK